MVVYYIFEECIQFFWSFTFSLVIHNAVRFAQIFSMIFLYSTSCICKWYYRNSAYAICIGSHKIHNSIHIVIPISIHLTFTQYRWHLRPEKIFDNKIIF